MSRTHGVASVGKDRQARRHEQRRTPRVLAGGVLHGLIMAPDVSFAARDLSFGGFAAELPMPLEVGEVHQVRFRPISGKAIELTARVIHHRQESRVGGAPRYVVGFQFLHNEADSRRLVNELVSSVADSLDLLGPGANRVQ